VLAGLAGAALLAVAFLPWFELSGRSANLWESFTVVDVVVACAIAVALAAGLAAFWGDASGLPVAGSSVTTGAGVIALVLVCARLIDPPGSGEVEREVGAWLGLLAAGGIALFGYLGMQEGRIRSR
jgi:hypothetical protein